MNRGEVWTVADEHGRWRVVVLSADEYNENIGWAYCAPVVRRAATGELSPYSVRLAEPDPVSGVAVVNVIESVPASAGIERVGMLTGATFTKVQDVFRAVFDR